MSDNKQLEQPQPPVYQQNDELDIIAFLRVLWKCKLFIIVVVVMAALSSAIATQYMTKIYRAETLLAPVNEAGDSGLSTALGGLGGLASMAGISIGSGGGVEQNLAALKSRNFLWPFIKKTIY